MLNLVRKHADSWLIKAILWTIVFAFIGTIFYSWGMGGASKVTGGVIATVEGSKVNFDEYNKTFNNLVEYYREQFKNQFSEDMIRKLDLKTVALDVVIQKKLLLMEARKQDIKVSDEEVGERVKSFPAFQKDKKFVSELYKNFLKSKRLTPYEFEEGQRDAIAMEKMEQLIRDGIKITKTEIAEAFKKEEDKVKLAYISMSDQHFKVPSPAISADEKKAHLDKNKAHFEVPENIAVEYVKLTAKEYEATAEIKDDEIQEYYNAKIAEFREEKKYRASHILLRPEQVKPDENLPTEEKKKILAEAEKSAKTKADDLIKKIKDGAPFEEMAKQFSEDKVSGANGGDLGVFPRGTMVPEFESALEKLNIGDISEPILTPFGYHIIKLIDKKPERVIPLDEANDTVIRALKANKAKSQIRRIVKQIYGTAKDNGNLSNAAQEHKIPVKKSPLFSADNHNLSDIGTVPEFYNMAFRLKDNLISAPVNTAEASYLVKVVERKPAYTPDISEIDAKITEEIIQEKNKALTSQKLAELEKSLAESKNLEKLAKDLGLEIKQTPLFSMEDSIPGIGNNAELKTTAFKLKQDETGKASSRNKHFLVKLVESKPAGEPTEDQSNKIQSRLKKEKGDVAFQSWLKELRAKANVMIDKTLL
jgi:peptidyl-prolyl cis-trans isomerase D